MSRAAIDLQARENIIHAAMIRSAFLAARGLSESQACHPPGLPAAYAGAHRPAASCGASDAAVGAASHSVRQRTQPDSHDVLISSLPSLACAPGAASLQPRGSFLPGDVTDGEGSDLD